MGAVTPVPVQQLVQQVGAGGPPAVVQGVVPVQTMQPVPQVQQALQQGCGATAAAQPHRQGAQALPPAQAAQAAGGGQPPPHSVHPANGSRSQAHVESATAREIVLRCTNCKRMLQLPPTNLEELRQVQCCACSQLMDVIGPPSIPQC